MIKFYIPKGELGRASVRFRAYVPLQYMREGDGYIKESKEAKQGDTVVLAKKTNFWDLDFLKDNKIKFIFDICDDKWNRHPEVWNRACDEASLITTTCELLQKRIKERTGKDSHIIGDPTERKREQPKFNPQKIIKLVYYGGRKSFSLVDWENNINQIKSVEKKFDNQYKFEIHAIANKPEKAAKRLGVYRESKILNMHDWTYERQGDLVRSGDIVILPMPTSHHLLKVKSPNRVIDGLQQGRFVIANPGVDSYEKLSDYIFLGTIKKGLEYALRNKEEVIDKIKKGQEYIDKNHSPEMIAKKWIETEKMI